MLTIALALTTALFTYDMHIGVIYAIGCIMGFFFGMGHTMLMVVVQVNADVKDLAPATAVSYFIRSLGSTMAVAVLGAILNSAVPTIFVTFMPNLMSLGITPAAAKAYIEAATSGTPMPTLTPQQSAALAEATARTFGQALRWCFLALVPAALIGFICLMIVPFKPLHSAKSSAAAIESSSDDEEVDIKGDVTEMKKIDV